MIKYMGMEHSEKYYVLYENRWDMTINITDDAVVRFNGTIIGYIWDDEFIIQLPWNDDRDRSIERRWGYIQNKVGLKNLILNKLIDL